MASPTVIRSTRSAVTRIVFFAFAGLLGACDRLALPTDPDGDGVPAELGDCDNSRADVAPTAPEVCDSVDNDCDGEIDEGFQTQWYADDDRDGYGNPAHIKLQCEASTGWVESASDCDDGSATSHPGAEDLCDGLDNDCSGATDDDADQDGYAPCPSDDSPGDCNNLNPAIHPDLIETWGDGLDQDCDGVADADLYVSLTSTSPEPSKPLFRSIQEAILSAEEGEVIAIDRGTYAERLELQGRDVTLLGMYETNRTIIDAQGTGSGLLIHRGETSATRIAHLTLINGVGTDGAVCGSSLGGTGPNGGGVCIQASSPVLEDLILSANQARDGGGLYISGGTPALNGLQLLDNHAQGDGGGLYAYASGLSVSRLWAEDNVAEQNGGGVLFLTVVPPVARRLSLVNNRATTGGGLALRVDSDAVIEHLYASGNSATSDAGAIWVDDSSPTLRQVLAEKNEVSGTPGRGGALYVEDSQLVMEHFLLQGNIATFGGAMSINWGSTPTLEAGIVTGNEAIQQGGGIFYYASGGFLRQAVVGGNSAGQTGGGVFFYQGSGPTLERTIVMDNTMPGGSSNLTAFANTGGTPQLAYSLVYSSMGGNGVSGVSTQTVIFQDPVFIEDPDNSWMNLALQLSADSPARELGPQGSVDPDGSPADAGAYGGPLATGWDLDGDGFPQWWNPRSDVSRCGTDLDDQDTSQGDACISSN